VGRGLAFGATTIIMCAFAFVASAVVAFIVLERDEEHNSKHQQLLCGASVPMFWFAHYAFDLSNYLGGSIMWNLCNPHYWRAVKNEFMPLFKARSPAIVPAVLQQLFMIIPGPFFWAVVLMKVRPSPIPPSLLFSSLHSSS
jgi:hypothetical protein